MRLPRGYAPAASHARPAEGQVARRGPVHRVLDSPEQACERVRERLQQGRPRLRGARAVPCGLPRDAGGHRRPARAGRERRDGAAFGDRHGRLRDRRARGHALQQDAVRERQRAGRARRGAAGADLRDRARGRARGLPHRVERDVAPGKGEPGAPRPADGPCRAFRVSLPRGAVRELVDPAARDVQRGVRARGRLRGPVDHGHVDEHLRAARPRDADRTLREERNPHGGVLEAAARGGGPARGRRGAEGSRPPLPGRADDGVELPLRRPAARLRHRRGAGSQKAIGISTFSGMLASTFVGIFFTPALYALFQRLREWVKRLVGK